MLTLGEIIHAGISVRGDNASTDAKAKKAAAPSLDKWQAEQSDQLPQGATFEAREFVKQFGPHAKVTRYLTVVAPLKI